jgi:hypothetical protein
VDLGWMSAVELVDPGCHGHLIRVVFSFFGERLTKSLSSLLDAMTKFGLGTAFPLADPLACIYQQLHVSAMYASVVWTTLNCWVRGITVGAGLVVYVALNSCFLLVMLLVCNEKVLIYVSVKLCRILEII